MAKKRNDYFLLLSELGSYAVKASELLEKIILNFNAEDIESLVEQMHEIEHEADGKLHEMENKLAREFITTIEREDIAVLGKELDDVIDYVEDVVLGLYMFDVKTLREESKEFAQLIHACTKELCRTLAKFPQFRKSDEVHTHIIEVNRLEEKGDELYTQAIRRLYTDGSDPREVLIWTDLFKRMEMCFDKCEEAVNVVHHVIMKNI